MEDWIQLIIDNIKLSDLVTHLVHYSVIAEQTTNDSNSVNVDTPQIYQGDTLMMNVWFSCSLYDDYLANLTVTTMQI